MSRRNDPNDGNKDVKVEKLYISDLVGFELYTMVWLINIPNKHNISDNLKRLDICLSVSHSIESVTCHFLVIKPCKLISKKMVKNVTREDYLNTEVKVKIDKFNKTIDGRLRNNIFFVKGEELLWYPR